MEKNITRAKINKNSEIGKIIKKLPEEYEIPYEQRNIDALYSLKPDAYKINQFDILSRNTPFDYEYFLSFFYSIPSLERFVDWDSKLDHRRISPKTIFNCAMIAYGHLKTNYSDRILTYFYDNYIYYWLIRNMDKLSFNISINGNKITVKSGKTNPDSLFDNLKKIIKITLPLSRFIDLWTGYIESYKYEEWVAEEDHYRNIKNMYMKEIIGVLEKLKE